MKNVIVAWVRRNAEHFEKNIPLSFIGTRNEKLGFCNDIDVLFLDGYELLDDRYRGYLKDLGFNLYDVNKIYIDLNEKYCLLNRFGDFEKKCFLRWLVIRDFFSGERIIHYDGDVVFNEDPLILSSILEGRTFILQGCPAFISISDLDWFYQYENNLNRFIDDIDGYSLMAWHERDGWELSEQHKWAGQRYRKLISSDQDLFSHLVHTNQIKQDKPSEILPLLKDYAIFENPLYLHLYVDRLPTKYIRCMGIDYLADKKVLFWHMQSSFNAYLYRFILRKTFLLKLVSKRLSNHLENINLETYVLSMITKIQAKIMDDRARQRVYEYFFEKDDFHAVLNDETWWKKDVFI